jgi:hypothetical protein
LFYSSRRKSGPMPKLRGKIGLFPGLKARSNSVRPITPSLFGLNGPLGFWPILSSHQLPRLLLSPDPRLLSSLVQPSTPPSASSHPRSAARRCRILAAPAAPPSAEAPLHRRSGGVELSGAEIRPLVH